MTAPTDTERADLAKLRNQIMGRVDMMLGEALRTRDQHASRLDALADEVDALTDHNARLLDVLLRLVDASKSRAGETDQEQSSRVEKWHEAMREAERLLGSAEL